ncbi:MAG: flagellar assembly protein FliW [Candidatus Binatia bacterium]|nr:flagellar assembly protein FliW [Candidatus Binatia bacterium]
MSSIESRPDLLSLWVGQAEAFFFPEGLLGFPGSRHFVLSRYQPPDGSVSPFFLLQTQESETSDREPGEYAALSFPLISPYWLVPDYHVTPPPGVLDTLGVQVATACVVLVIVTLRERLEEITVNLQGPLLLSPATRRGVQLVVEQYPVRYPLLGSGGKVSSDL